MRKQKGFTLIELLVVIAIIAIISSLVMTVLSGARTRSRDSRRVEDIRSIETAINIYAANNDGVYPVVTPAETINGTTDTLSQTLINTNVMTLIPTDPQHPSNFYQYESNGTTYTITFCLETDTVQGYSEGCTNTISQ